ncbi:hypothetical protein BUE93_21665 [Chromobacterium amazonense]|uniref:Mobilization protein n=1 Tax=Chromobacterium amazonense TaxID=1382803 RepID=A0A2S9WYM9_9NEIS|nr:hypothetical protein BUE93_21665 [Chromobacterium amazonense]
MDLMKKRLQATQERLEQMKAERKAVQKERRQVVKQSRADQARKAQLVGEAVLRRVEAGDWDEADFLSMMDAALSRPVDRALFGLED